MLRTNLSTRPFYNERAVHVVLALVGLVVLTLTILNLVEVVRLSRQNTVLSGRIREDRSAATDLSRKAREIRQGINQEELKTIVAAAREANTLIDGRTFSWTALFNQLETTLPPEVMLASVRPTIDDGETRITLIVLGRRTADLDEFMEKLEATGAFENVLPRQQNLNDDGLTQVTIEALYVPDTSDDAGTATPATPPPAKPAPATPPVKATAAISGGAR
jgi:Tfp pilus assembly protein PilN